jgi:hypothetical protein
LDLLEALAHKDPQDQEVYKETMVQLVLEETQDQKDHRVMMDQTVPQDQQVLQELEFKVQRVLQVILEQQVLQEQLELGRLVLED